MSGKTIVGDTKILVVRVVELYICFLRGGGYDLLSKGACIDRGMYMIDVKRVNTWRSL